MIEEDTGQYERVGPCNIYKIYTRMILFIEEVEFGLYFAGAVLPTSHLKIFHLRHVSKMWYYHIGYGQTLSFWACPHLLHVLKVTPRIYFLLWTPLPPPECAGACSSGCNGTQEHQTQEQAALHRMSKQQKRESSLTHSCPG